MLSIIEALADAPAHLGLHLHGEGSSVDRFHAYCDMHSDVHRAAAAFAAQGITPGSAVIFPFVTTYEAIVSFLGLITLGAIPYSVKPAQVGGTRAAYSEFVAHVCRLYKVQNMMTWTGVELPDVKTIGLHDSPLAASVITSRTANDTDVAFVQFSSGSTSFPKGIPVTHGAALQNIGMITRHDGRGEASVMHSWLPLYHDMGLIGGLLSCLASRSPLWLRTPLWFLADPWRWLEELSRERVFAIAIPDFALGYTLKALQHVDPDDLASLDLSSIRAAYLGSEPINAQHLTAFMTQLAPAGWRPEAFVPCYGMAEAVLMVSGLPLDQSFRVKTLTSGQSYVGLGAVFKEFHLSIVDEQTRVTLPDGAVGEVVLSGGSLAHAYLADNRVLLDAAGVYQTGDLGFVEDGQLFITGRCGERLKINGQSFFLADFEQAAGVVEAVNRAKVAAFGADDGVHLACELRGARSPEQLQELSEQIMAAVLAKLGVKLVSERIHFVGKGAIPKTSSGKVQRKLLAKSVKI